MTTLERLQSDLRYAKLQTAARQIFMAIKYPEHARTYLEKALVSIQGAEDAAEVLWKHPDAKELRERARDWRLLVDREIARTG
jgi:hypothetical protein